MGQFFHSVTLDENICMGCTNCIKKCPTQAIRLRNGKAWIKTELCIDCAECIRACPYHAKSAKTDSIEEMSLFKHTVALPAPSLYGQFKNLEDIDYVLTGLKMLGFDSVFEVSAGAELISEATRKLMQSSKLKTPVISSACPAVMRLIRIKYPSLCDHVLPLMPPMEVAARMAKREVQDKTGLDLKDIGVFFISPCPAKVTDIRSPITNKRSWVDKIISISRIYPMLLDKMNRIKTPEPLTRSGLIGVSWAKSGGESSALIKEKYLSADGIENVMAVLEEMDNEHLKELDFIELNACSGGCVGGIFNVENPYVAQARVNQLRKYLPISTNHLSQEKRAYRLGDMYNQFPLEYMPVISLSDNIADAIKIMQDIDDIYEQLPSLDCGSCGAPTCRALAEDIARGDARKSDCVFFVFDTIMKDSPEKSSEKIRHLISKWKEFPK